MQNHVLINPARIIDHLVQEIPHGGMFIDIFDMIQIQQKLLLAF